LSLSDRPALPALVSAQSLLAELPSHELPVYSRALHRSEVAAGHESGGGTGSPEVRREPPEAAETCANRMGGEFSNRRPPAVAFALDQGSSPGASAIVAAVSMAVVGQLQVMVPSKVMMRRTLLVLFYHFPNTEGGRGGRGNVYWSYVSSIHVPRRA